MKSGATKTEKTSGKMKMMIIKGETSMNKIKIKVKTNRKPTEASSSSTSQAIHR